MTTQIALLRGINVGGHKMVAMADLRTLITQLGFADVRSLLQSGNVVFTGGSRTGSRHLGQHPRHNPGTEYHRQDRKNRDLGERNEDREVQ